MPVGSQTHNACANAARSAWVLTARAGNLSTGAQAFSAGLNVAVSGIPYPINTL